MLYDPARHEVLRDLPWDEARVGATIERIVGDTEARFSPQSFWPIHPKDADEGDTEPFYPLYFGAAGVVWALHYLQAVGAVALRRSYAGSIEPLPRLNRQWLRASGSTDFFSYLMGDTGILLLRYWLDPAEDIASEIERCILGNLDNPTRELMWGSPGTLLASLFMHDRTRQERFADLFRTTAQKLWSQLVWSPKYECHYWTQDMYGERTTYLDAVHGFVATALPLIHGRHLLASDEWSAWEQRIANTIGRTAARDGSLVNWRVQLDSPAGSASRMLMQFCHGAPGFVICLGDLPSASLDEVLIGGGEAIWQAGPLAKGSNLCHGTAGNGYAFLKLYERFRDPKWLERARAFAMHAIFQTEADATRYGQLRYSLWTGDLGLAIYLWDCLRGVGKFPSLDVAFAG